MPYLVALAFACLILVCGALFIWRSQVILQSRFEQAKQQLHEQKLDGLLDPEWEGGDLERLNREDINLTMPALDLMWIGIARLLAVRWYVLVPAVFGFCLGLAWAISKWW